MQGASLEFDDRLINAGHWPFGRLAVLSASYGAGGGSKKRRCLSFPKIPSVADSRD